MQFNISNLDKNISKDKKKYFYKVNGKNSMESYKEKTTKVEQDKNKLEEKFVRTIFKNNNILNN